MGKFGPATSTNLKVSANGWKVTGNAVDNKNRPEALFITLSSWVKPKLSLVKAKALATSNPDEVAVEIAKDFESMVNRTKRNLAQYFDPDYFDTASIIFTYDFAASLAKVGKRQFVEIEINIDTVNDIDINDEPAPNVGSGKVNHIPFKDFVKPMEKAVNKILMGDAFNPAKTNMDFSTKKGTK